MALRVGGALVCTLMCLYWWNVTTAGWPTGGLGFRVLLAIGMAAPLAAAFVVLRRPSARADELVRLGALGASVFAFGGPILLNAWIRGGEWERYVWVIQQGYPCNTMGGGPGGLWVAGTSWLFAFGALTLAVADRTGPVRWSLGVAGGIGSLALLAAAMFPIPEVFASILGC